MKIKILVIFILGTVSIFAQANNWSEPVKVIDIVAGYKDGFVLFRTEGALHNPNGNCDTSYYSLDPEHADVDKALSILLAAQRSGSKIEVGVEPSECGRSVQHLQNKIKVTRIRSL